MVLGQTTSTLSGGEAQRVKLAKELMNQDNKKRLYLFDEPTTGLHPHDVVKIIDVLRKLIHQGNSVIEHNPAVIVQADYIIDLGIGGGKNGGEVITCGTLQTVLQSTNSLTVQMLRKWLK